MAKSSTNGDIKPGSQLDHGKYQIIRLIGRGGMGSVYEAENLRAHKRVAIKSVNPTFAGSEQLSQRLVREAQAAARIRHSNVVDVYDVIAETDALYLVMEYLEGEPLTSQLKRGGLSPFAIIALLLPALHGVAAAHKRGVIHRDLKPDNIFLAREDSGRVTPKVLDFGISKLQERGPDQLSLTGAGNVLGTPHYMSVEQLAGAKDIDGRSDVYAFGIILYEALTGRLPFEADTFPELIYKITSTTPPEIKQLRAELPTTLARLVSWAMARDRDDRIKSMDALIKELEPFATAHGWNSELTHADGPGMQPIVPRSRTSRPPADTSTTEPHTTAAVSGKRRLLLAALVLSALAGALGVWKSLPHPEPQTDQAAATAPPPAARPSAQPTPDEPIAHEDRQETLIQAIAPPEPPSPAAPELQAPAPNPTPEKHPPAQTTKRRIPPTPIQPAPAEHPDPNESPPTPATPTQAPRDPRTFRVLPPQAQSISRDSERDVFDEHLHPLRWRPRRSNQTHRRHRSRFRQQPLGLLQRA